MPPRRERGLFLTVAFTGSIGSALYLAYHRDVLAGEQMIYDVEIVHLRPEGASVQGRVTVDGTLAVEAEIFFAHLDQARSKQLFGDHNFVFSGELKHLLGQMRK